MEELWDPPTRKSLAKTDQMFPFARSILKTNIPPGLKQNALPPMVSALDLCYPEKSPLPGTFEQRTTCQDERSSPFEQNYPIFDRSFGHQDACETISTDDLELLVGNRVCPMDGYGTIQATHLEGDFEPVHKLRFDDRKKMVHHNVDTKSRGIVSASNDDLIHFASCTQKPDPTREDGNHCERGTFQAELDDNENLFGEDVQYPNEIECLENSHSSFVVNNLNVREKTASGDDATHFFAVRIQPELFESAISNFAWFTTRKVLNSPPCLDWLDLEVGFLALHGNLERGLNDHKQAFIQQKNLRFSAAAKKFEPVLNSRLGPPLLNPSEAFGLAQWEIFHHATRDAHLRRAAAERNNNNENLEDHDAEESRLERFINSKDVPIPVFSREFRNYNSHLWDRENGGFYEPGSSPPFRHIADCVERIWEMAPRNETERTNLSEFELVQKRRRERESNMTPHDRKIRQRVIDK